MLSNYIINLGRLTRFATYTIFVYHNLRISIKRIDLVTKYRLFAQQITIKILVTYEYISIRFHFTYSFVLDVGHVLLLIKDTQRIGHWLIWNLMRNHVFINDHLRSIVNEHTLGSYYYLISDC